MALSSLSVSSPAAYRVLAQPARSLLFGRYLDENAFKKHLLDSALLDLQQDGFQPNYNGNTGIKEIAFPTSPNFNPNAKPDLDVTESFQACVEGALKEVGQILGVSDLNPNAHGRHPIKSWLHPLRMAKAIHFYAQTMTTGGRFDTKFNPALPGRDAQGSIQYAVYKGKVVPCGYLSNNFYGQMMAAFGFPKWMACAIGKVYTCGALDIVLQGRFPDKALRQFRDPESDQAAIRSGYRDYLDGKPWNEGCDPCAGMPVGNTSNHVLASRAA